MAAIAARSAGQPDIGAYWFGPRRRCLAASSTSRGGGSKSGKPCERLIAPCSAARRDITVKMVVPTSGSLLSSGITGTRMNRGQRSAIRYPRCFWRDTAQVHPCSLARRVPAARRSRQKHLGYRSPYDAGRPHRGSRRVRSQSVCGNRRAAGTRRASPQGRARGVFPQTLWRRTAGARRRSSRRPLGRVQARRSAPAAAIAATMMPASLPKCAGRISARLSSSGPKWLQFSVTPPPTMNRSGHSSAW